jgi:hypothetical protein
VNIKDTIAAAHQRGAHRTFGAAPMVKHPVKLTDPSTLEICDDPLPAARASCGNKYEPIFKKLKLGQAIKCQPTEIGRLGGALRKYVEVHALNATVKTIKDYGDGRGRVWLMALPEAKAKLASVRG